MSDTLNEQVSACMDGELHATETELLLRRLATDPAVRARWERYHLISDALKNNLPRHFSRDIPTRVRNAIDREPAPQRRLTLTTLLKPAIGFAVAASVAALAIFSVQTLNRDTQPPARAQLPPAPVAVTSTLSAVPTVPAQTVSATGTRWDRTQPEVAERLNTYLLNHSGHADTAGMQAVLPYVRIVGYDEGE